VRARWKSRAILPEVKFIQVPSSTTTSFQQYNLSTALPSCGPRDPELFLASRFLISQAVQALRGMGYEWFFRIGDDSKLSQPVTYDIFDRLNQAGKRYGFSKIVLDNEVCLGDLWSSMVSLCGQLKGDSCSPFLEQWPVGVVVITSFEVSHYSVWESPVFRRVSLMAEQALHSGGTAVYWSDAAIHTVGMLAFLRQQEVEWLGDVMYSVQMNKKGTATPPLENKAKSLAPVESTMRAPRLAGLNQLFQPQRFGWLGGDVAVSCALPSRQEMSNVLKWSGISKDKEAAVAAAAVPKRYLWLFGDSLIGTSSSTRCVLYMLWRRHVFYCFVLVCCCVLCIVKATRG
jgi:hypothetical protein